MYISQLWRAGKIPAALSTIIAQLRVNTASWLSFQYIQFTQYPSFFFVGGAEEDEDFDDDEMFEESEVQLGTVVPLAGPPESLLFKDVDWHRWDGGKAGGWPVS